MKVVNAVINKIPKNINYKMWLIVSLVLSFISLIGGIVVVPFAKKLLVKYLVILRPGSFLRSKHEGVVPLSYKLYLWNVTNPKEFSSGKEKPKMQEVGPYVFS